MLVGPFTRIQTAQASRAVGFIVSRKEPSDRRWASADGDRHRRSIRPELDHHITGRNEQ